MSLLGDGLFERARSTSFALLGLAAAVGLAAIAIALNQDWPLIAGSPIPDRPCAGQADRDQPPRRAPRGGGRRDAGILAAAPAGGTAAKRELGARPAEPVAAEPDAQTVEDAAPVTRGGGETVGEGGDGASPRLTPKPSPGAVSQPASQPAPGPAPTPEASPPPPPTPPVATPPLASAPTAASGPPGNGHAYGWENGKAKGHSR